MRLEKFTKSDYKRKRIMVVSFILIFLFIFCFVIYKSYAFYEEEAEYNVLKGQVGDFGYDIKMLSVVVDNEKSKTIPERGLYKTNVECSNGTTGEWDYNAWNLTLENVSESAKCSITFTSNLTEAEYNTYINAGVSLRRSTYRGKDITSYLTSEGELNLYTQISSGRFNDIYVGDYINANNVTWLVADIDNYLYTGYDPSLTKHHVTIIPAGILGKERMNETHTTEGGYLNSNMVQVVLENLISNEGLIGKTFGTHVIEYHNLLSSGINKEAVNQSGGNTAGAANAWSWTKRKIDLMSEVNVYGTTIFSSSGYDKGFETQYAIFRLNPKYKNSDGKQAITYWLRDVTGSTSFAYVRDLGNSDVRYNGAMNINGVRPRFLIG